ncbi:MAG: hypothetical protein ACLFQ5_11240, partial [Oceanicaulis sp.]
MPMLSISSPTRASLWQGRVYTAAVFALALAGAILTGLDAPGAGAAFIAATGLYIAGSTVLWLRGDYILRMFGCGWPIVLAKADEMQKAQRQRAFSFTFLAFLSVFSLGLGLHIGVMVGQHLDGESVYRMMKDENVTFSMAVPTVWLMLFQYIDATPGASLDELNLTGVGVGGSAPPIAMIERFRKSGID